MKLLPRKIRRGLKRLQKVANHTGWRTAILYHILPQNTVVRAKIDNVELTLRAGSPDMEVAIECITSEYSFLSRYFDDTYEGVIIDAGGYIGTAAIAFARQCARSKIISIEPSSENLEILRINAAQFTNIQIRRAALTAASSDSIPLRNRGTGQWGFTIVESPEDSDEAAPIENVSTISIDDLLEEFGGNVGFLKLDIEGGEKGIFDVASPALKAVPYIFVELHDHIVAGCSEAFFHFSTNREVVKFSGEKYLSIKR